LREYANLAEQVMITGMDTYFEIWSTERWGSVLAEIGASGSNIAEQLAALGI
jgi:MraZ protein